MNTQKILDFCFRKFLEKMANQKVATVEKETQTLILFTNEVIENSKGSFELLKIKCNF